MILANLKCGHVILKLISVKLKKRGLMYNFKNKTVNLHMQLQLVQ